MARKFGLKSYQVRKSELSTKKAKLYNADRRALGTVTGYKVQEAIHMKTQLLSVFYRTERYNSFIIYTENIILFKLVNTMQFRTPLCR